MSDVAVKSAGELQKPQASGSRLSLCLVGKTGGGKSSLGNSLLGSDAFKVNFSPRSATFSCEVKTSESGDTRPVTVVDTPGTMDTRNVTAALGELRKAIQKCPFGFHAFLVVLPVGRFTEEEFDAIRALACVFGEEVFEYSIFVFTNADRCDNDLNEFRQALDEARAEDKNLDSLLQTCSNRLVIIDNSKRCDKEVQKKQISQLFKTVDDLHAAKGKKYTNHLFEEVQKEMEARKKLEEENERMKKEEEEKLQKKMEELLKIQDQLERAAEEQKIKMEQQEKMHKMQMEHQAAILQQARSDNERAIRSMQDTLRADYNKSKDYEDQMRRRFNRDLEDRQETHKRELREQESRLRQEYQTELSGAQQKLKLKMSRLECEIADLKKGSKWNPVNWFG